MSTPSATVLAGQPIGTRTKVTGIALPPATHQRLLEMGLTVGTECTVVRYAPLGDPLEIRVRGYHLSLRQSEAAGIQVSVVS
jgi:Fe2+ transport system protein FeoA